MAVATHARESRWSDVWVVGHRRVADRLEDAAKKVASRWTIPTLTIDKKQHPGGEWVLNVYWTYGPVLNGAGMSDARQFVRRVMEAGKNPGTTDPVCLLKPSDPQKKSFRRIPRDEFLAQKDRM